MDLKYVHDINAGRKVALAVPVSRLPGDWPGDPNQVFELPGYWRAAAEVPADLRERGTVSTEQLWAMADQAAWGERSWTDVMIASFAWGYVNAPYGPFRLRRILADPANAHCLEDSLRIAAANASVHPVTAYHLLRTAPADGGVRLKWFGPAFFTRFLFAAGGAGGSSCVLDQGRADVVRRLTGTRTCCAGRTGRPRSTPSTWASSKASHSRTIRRDCGSPRAGSCPPNPEPQPLPPHLSRPRGEARAGAPLVGLPSETVGGDP